MKILIVSDSHYYNESLDHVLNIHKNCEVKIHCGDSSLPADHTLIKEFDYVVKGNHDNEDYPIYSIFQNILITHGHIFDVYRSYDKLIELCHNHHCSICLHGHTHIPTIQTIDGITFINPGSLMMNRGSYGYGTYAILTIEDEKIDTKHYHYENDTIVPQSVYNESIELLEEIKKLI